MLLALLQLPIEVGLHRGLDLGLGAKLLFAQLRGFLLVVGHQPLLGLAQACALRLLRPALAKLMSTHAARAVVFLVGTRLMTIYLWHLPVIIILAGSALLIPGASPEPASPAWWWSRILVYLLVLGVLFALSLLVGRWEQPIEAGPTPPVAVTVLAAALTFLPTFLVDGGVAGRWSTTVKKGEAVMQLEPFRRIEAADRRALEAEGEHLLAFTEPEASSRAVSWTRA